MALIDLRVKGNQPGGLNRHERRSVARIFRTGRVKTHYRWSCLGHTHHTANTARKRNVFSLPAGSLRTLRERIYNEMAANVRDMQDQLLVHGS